MKKCFLLFSTLFLVMVNSVSLAQGTWKILEKYECLSVSLYDTEDKTSLDDNENHAIVTYLQLNGTKKSAELITIVIGTDYSYYAEILSKESYVYGDYEYVRYFGRNCEKDSGPADVIIAFVYEKNSSKVVPFNIVYKFDFSSTEIFLGRIVRDV